MHLRVRLTKTNMNANMLVSLPTADIEESFHKTALKGTNFRLVDSYLFH